MSNNNEKTQEGVEITFQDLAKVVDESFEFNAYIDKQANLALDIDAENREKIQALETALEEYFEDLKVQHSLIDHALEQLKQAEQHDERQLDQMDAIAKVLESISEESDRFQELVKEDAKVQMELNLAIANLKDAVKA